MKNKDKNLINKLTNDLTQVKPVACCTHRFILALAVILVCSLALFFMKGGLRLADNIIFTPAFVTESLLLCISGLLSGWAAFKLSIPDYRVRLPVMVSLLIPTFVWLSLNIWCYMMLKDRIAEQWSHIERFGIETVELTFLVAIPSAILFYLISRAAPVNKNLTAYAVILSSASFGALAVRLTCGMNDYAHLLFYHFLPVLALGLLGLALGRFFIRGHV